MRKQKWSDFYGAIFGAVTVAAVALGAKHMQKKYGVRNVSSLMDYKKIANYAFEKFVLDNEKLLDAVGSKMSTTEE